jgi:Zn-dependent protease with chaperone function
MRSSPGAVPGETLRGQQSPPDNAAQQGKQADSEASSHAENGTAQYTLSHERYQKAVAYSRAAYVLYFVEAFLGIGAAWFFLRLGLAARFRDIAENVSERRWVQGLVFVPLLAFAMELCTLPVNIYGHKLSRRYEQSVQGWGSWLWDWTKYEVLIVAFAVVIVLLLDFAMRRSPRRWWLYFWLAVLPVIAVLTFSTPLVIDPLFHHFEPLAKKYPDLTASIQKLTQRAGVPIPEERIFLMDASAKTNTINAYATGLGASKRVVIWDTTINKLSAEETLFIVGHELGHFVLGHVFQAALFSAGMLLLAMYLLFRGLHWALDRWAADWKIYGANDWAALAVLLLLVNVFSFLGEPVTNGFSRAQEHRADIYGLEVIHGLIPNSEEIAARAFQDLGEMDLSDPNPPAFITFWLYSHPPLADRLVFAHSYDPWSQGEATRYVK